MIAQFLFIRLSLIYEKQTTQTSDKMQSNTFIQPTPATFTSKKVIRDIKTFISKTTSRVRSVFQKKARVEELNTTSELPLIKKCEIIVEATIQEVTNAYNHVRDNYYPIIVDFIREHKDKLKYIFSPEKIILLKQGYEISKSVLECDTVRRSTSPLNLIKNFTMETTKRVVERVTNVSLNVQEIVSDLYNVVATGDVTSLVDCISKHLSCYEKTRWTVEFKKNLSVEYAIEFVVRWIFAKYIG
jgi:hypothetical protein